MPRRSVPDVESLTPHRPSGGLTFQQPEPDPLIPSSTSPWPNDETTSLPADDLLDASPSVSEPSSDELHDPSDAPRSSSKGSSGSALSKRTLRDAVRNGVLMAGGIAHEFLAKEQAQQQVGLYLADGGDAEAIGDPLANIAHRHGGIGDAGNPDVVDAINALIGLAVYAAKQFARATEARRLRAEASQRQAVPDGAGEPVEAA